MVVVTYSAGNWAKSGCEGRAFMLGIRRAKVHVGTVLIYFSGMLTDKGGLGVRWGE